jgi:hypothetical protein
MRCDDLQLLRLIDDCESQEQHGPLLNGRNLMEAAGAGRPIDWNQDDRTFARELILAHRAGYFGSKDLPVSGVGQLHPFADPNRWLQHINDIRLTLDGRDRARGREIQRPLPDPDDDDNRLISGMTLEERSPARWATSTPARSCRDTCGSPASPLSFWRTTLPAASGSGCSQCSRPSMTAGRRRGGPSATSLAGGSKAGITPHPPRRPTAARRTTRRSGLERCRGRLIVVDRPADAVRALTPLGQDVRIAALDSDVREVADR